MQRAPRVQISCRGLDLVLKLQALESFEAISILIASPVFKYPTEKMESFKLVGGGFQDEGEGITGNSLPLNPKSNPALCLQGVDLEVKGFGFRV